MSPSTFRRRVLRGTSSAAALLVAAVTGCGQGPVELRTTDLVTGPGLHVGGERLRPREVLAADETWVAVTIGPGQAATGSIRLDGGAALGLAGSLQCEPVAGASAGRLAVVAAAAHRPDLEFAVDVATAGGWWRHEIDLGDFSESEARLSFRADIPPGCVLHLREATVRHFRPRSSPAEAPGVQLLLVSVDTLRLDALGAFGGAVATPHLDRLAGESEVFTSCWAAASWTKPSHASLLTGFHPDTHRALMLDQSIDPALPTLASSLREGGLVTGALVYDCTWLSPRWGFGKGFDSYRVTRWRAGRQAAAAGEWMLDHRGDDFFFFLHTFEPHSDFNLLPYEAPGLTRAAIAARWGVTGFGCRGGLCASQLLSALTRGEVPPHDRDREVLRFSYDEGVRYLDGALGELFETLRAGGLWDELTVVVTSDHGEEFAEHGGWGHETLHEEILRVPLLVKWPRGDRAGLVNDAPCSGIDIAPTLLTVAGLEPRHLPGSDLRELPPDAVVMAGTLERAVIVDGLKGLFGGKGGDRLYDLRVDPGETTDLAAARPDDLRRLAGILEAERRSALELHRRLGSAQQEGEVVLSEAERERLRAFGYLQ